MRDGSLGAASGSESADLHGLALMAGKCILFKPLESLPARIVSSSQNVSLRLPALLKPFVLRRLDRWLEAALQHAVFGVYDHIHRIDTKTPLVQARDDSSNLCVVRAMVSKTYL